MQDNLKTIIETVGSVLGYQDPYLLLRMRTRKHDIVFARQLMFYFSWLYTEYSLAQLGEQLGRNHSTIVYARKVITNYMYSKRRYAQIIETIREQLQHCLLQRQMFYMTVDKQNKSLLVFCRSNMKANMLAEMWNHIQKNYQEYKSYTIQFHNMPAIVQQPFYNWKHETVQSITV